MNSLFALRIVRPPDVCEAPSRFRAGLYCKGILDAFDGGGLGEAALYTLALAAATSLTAAEERHPGMEVEIVEFLEQAETYEHAMARQLAEITDPTHCHRTVLATLLVACGATSHGER